MRFHSWIWDGGRTVFSATARPIVKLLHQTQHTYLGPCGSVPVGELGEGGGACMQSIQYHSKTYTLWQLNSASTELFVQCLVAAFAAFNATRTVAWVCHQNCVRTSTWNCGPVRKFHTVSHRLGTRAAGMFIKARGTIDPSKNENKRWRAATLRNKIQPRKVVRLNRPPALALRVHPVMHQSLYGCSATALYCGRQTFPTKTRWWGVWRDTCGGSGRGAQIIEECQAQ